MEELLQPRQEKLIVRNDQMVFSVPSNEEGVDEIVYIADQDAGATPQAPINLGGSWANLVDGDAMLDALDRLGREAPPTPPITSIE